MGAVFVREAICDSFMQGAEDQIELFHGYTYSGHPVACAAGLAALDTYQEEDLFSRGKDLAPYWADAVHIGLKDCPYVVDVRTIGLMGAIELEPLPGRPAKRAFDVFRSAYEAGILIRTTGDVIALSPPLIISRAQVDELIGKLRNLLLKA
jgi:beta-alanine--pyruvate transaminase